MDALEDVADGPVAATLGAELAEAGIDRVKPNQLDHSYDRPMARLNVELEAIQPINALSHRCAANPDHESEWNNRVHTKVLKLALGNNETRLRFRTVSAPRISSDSRPTHSPGVTISNVVDYVMLLEPSRSTRDSIASVATTTSSFLNLFSYEAVWT